MWQLRGEHILYVIFQDIVGRLEQGELAQMVLLVGSRPHSTGSARASHCSRILYLDHTSASCTSTCSSHGCKAAKRFWKRESLRGLPEWQQNHPGPACGISVIQLQSTRALPFGRHRSRSVDHLFHHRQPGNCLFYGVIDRQRVGGLSHRGLRIDMSRELIKGLGRRLSRSLAIFLRSGQREFGG